MPHVIGTDFGTSNSGTVLWKGDMNEKGEKLFLTIGTLLFDSGKHFPSFVYYDNNDDNNAEPVEFGSDAQAMLQTDPKHTIYDFKRLIGRRFDEPEFQSYRPYLTYDVDKDANGQIVVKIGNHTLMPEEIAADLMAHMLKTALMKYDDLIIERWMVSVPAYYDSPKRLKTKRAAMLAIEKLRKSKESKLFENRIRLPDYSNTDPADVREIQLVSEPTAALHTYLAKKRSTIPPDKYILLFDLGAGTLDISIGKINSEVDPFTGEMKEALQVTRKHGNNDLGGRRMDERIYAFVESRIREQLRAEGRENVFTDATRAELKHAVEKAKIGLSRKTSTEIYLEKEHISFELDRRTMEKQISELLSQVRTEIRAALRGHQDQQNPDEPITKDQLGAVILVGGPSKMPCIQEIVQEETIAIESVPNWDPLMCVAEGAARYAVNPSATTEPPAHKYAICVEMMPDVVIPWEIASTGDHFPLKGKKEVLVQRLPNSSRLYNNTIFFVTSDNGQSRIFNKFSFAVAGGSGKSSFTLDYPWNRIVHFNDAMNHKLPYIFDNITVEYFINEEGLLKKPKFIDPATGVEITIPDVPLLDYGAVKTQDIQAFEQSRESCARAEWNKIEEGLDQKIREKMMTEGKDRRQAEYEVLIEPHPPLTFEELRIFARAAILLGQKYHMNPEDSARNQRNFDNARIKSTANEQILNGIVNGTKTGLSGVLPEDRFFSELQCTAESLANGK